MTGGYLPPVKMKNTSSKQGALTKTNTATPDLKSKSSVHVTETAGTISSVTTRAQNNKTSAPLSNRRATNAVKLTRSLSRSQDSLAYPSATVKLKLNGAAKTRPQSALGLQNTKFEVVFSFSEFSLQQFIIKVSLFFLSQCTGMQPNQS